MYHVLCSFLAFFAYDQIQTLTFAVHDTGIGIKDGCLEDLFQPFFQIVAGSPQIYGGTGLGLVISKKLSQLMYGQFGYLY